MDISSAWNVITSLHALPNPAGKLGNPRMFLVQTGLLFLLLAPDELGWLPALTPSLGVQNFLQESSGRAWLPKHPPQWPTLCQEDLDGCSVLSRVHA